MSVMRSIQKLIKHSTHHCVYTGASALVKMELLVFPGIYFRPLNLCAITVLPSCHDAVLLSCHFAVLLSHHFAILLSCCPANISRGRNVKSYS